MKFRRFQQRHTIHEHSVINKGVYKLLLQLLQQHYEPLSDEPISFYKYHRQIHMKKKSLLRI